MAAVSRIRGGPNVVNFPQASIHAGERLSEALVRERFLILRQQLISFLSYRLGSIAEAEDASQTVFLRIWERSGTLTDENFTALLFVTARNLSIDLIRARSRHATNSGGCDDELADIADNAPLADRVLGAKQDLLLIQRLLTELPGKCRKAFVAYKFDGEEYEQIAADMGVTESMVRKYVLRAVAHCATRFAQLEGWE